MDHLIPQFPPTPSVGSLVKKILAVNPDLGVHEIAAIIRRSSRDPGERSGEFTAATVIDEKLALDLARASRD